MTPQDAWNQADRSPPTLTTADADGLPAGAAFLCVHTATGKEVAARSVARDTFRLPEQTTSSSSGFSIPECGLGVALAIGGSLYVRSVRRSTVVRHQGKSVVNTSMSSTYLPIPRNWAAYDDT